jgi:diguanylate cyclase (GGDEF)-like protein/PAS domain S-box-containing protein
VERLRGFTPAEVMSLPVEAALMPESAKIMNAALMHRIQRIAAGEAPNSAVTTEIDQPHRDGYVVRTEVVTTILLDDTGQPASVLGVTRDITERKKAQEEQQLAALVYRNSSEAMIVTDASNLIESVNPAFEQITGYTFDEVKGKNPKILASGRHGKSFIKHMWQDLNTSGCWQGEIWNRRKDGIFFLGQLSINTNYAADGSVDRRVALFSDITKKKEAVDLIWRQANFDSLTQLPNRRMFRDRLEQEIKKATRASRQLALLFVDLDHFKEVNDTLGHVKGDNLIVEAAHRLVASVRETDTVARMGGDEFTIILNELDDIENIERAATSILRSLAMPFHIDESVVYISASMGITLYPNDATDIDDLLKNVDQAMYVAKKAGRNRHSYFTQHLQKAAQSRLRLIADLHEAVSGNQLRVYFQPIIDLNSGRVLKAEALVRWMHPQRGLVSPADFIPVAEETGLISEVGDWVFQEALRWTARWRELVNDVFQVSVNRSPIEFAKETSRDSWVQILKSMGLPGASVVVEITEGVLVDSDSPAFAALVAYRDSGIQVSIDDFGTGYSSLAYLKKFDIDYLKIDQSFIKNLAVGSSDLALSKAIIVMAHELGLKVIAEGVETTEQRDLLLAAGCDYAQGYLFSKPIPPEEFEVFLMSV